MTINGIDFDQRLESARRLLYDKIDWRAQLEWMGPFFQVIPLPPERDDTLETFRDMIQRLMDRPINSLDIDDSPEIRKATIEAYKKHMEQYLACSPPKIQFELIRIK